MKGLDSAFSIETRMHSFNALAARGFALCFVSAVLDRASWARRFVALRWSPSQPHWKMPSSRPAYFSYTTFATTVLSCTARR